ncbi:MAG: HD domain-containing protein [Selenomonadaceae bacterium]|nr:HD domain-containing protein [Selenomonadaceae bacterium]
MKALTVSQLKAGMELARTVVNDDMVVILSENTLLTKAHITRLNFLNIPQVYVKDEYELSPNYQSVMTIFNRSNAFAAEYREVIREVNGIFEAAANSGEIPVEKTRDLVRDSLEPMSKQSGVIDYLYELNHMADDLFNHSMRVSILAGVIGKWMYKKTSVVNELILAGFLHDIGKTKFPPRLQSRRVETLNGEDFERYMQHTIDGSRLLNASSKIPEGVKLAALQHHECMDGSGFPFATRGEEIHEYAKIIAIADLYDNITTEREGFVRQTPFTAIARITEQMYTKLDPAISVAILKRIKDAFLGSTVVLNNGLTGTIINYPHDFAEHPLVRIDQDNIIDLNQHRSIKIVEYNPKQ